MVYKLLSRKIKNATLDILSYKNDCILLIITVKLKSFSVSVGYIDVCSVTF